MKIFIYGPPGSGKSTLAFRLAEELSLPLYHIDHFFFKAPNIHVDFETGLAELKDTLPSDNWIVEGNHGKTLEFLAAEADHVIILKMSRITCLYRIIKRHLQKCPKLKKATSEGWEDTLSLQFLWFTVFKFPKLYKIHIQRINSNLSGKIHYTSDSRAFDCLTSKTSDN